MKGSGQHYQGEFQLPAEHRGRALFCIFAELAGQTVQGWKSEVMAYSGGGTGKGGSQRRRAEPDAGDTGVGLGGAPKAGLPASTFTAGPEPPSLGGPLTGKDTSGGVCHLF